MLDKYIKNKVLKEILDWVIAFAFAYIMFLIVQTFLFQNAKVDGISMEPTLQDGDFVIINRLQYYLNEPEYNDIVAFPYQQNRSKKFIKRIIGKPKDIIDIKDGNVYVNGNLVENTFSNFATEPRELDYPVEVPEGYYFALGDNRADSHDSRFYDVGFVERKDLIGRVKTRIWPLGKFGTITENKD